MPGWYIHMDIARRVFNDMDKNESAAHVFADAGPKPQKLIQIAKDHPAYVALGSIGPDIFALLPDFQGWQGNFIRWVADTGEKIYDEVDPFIGSYEDILKKTMESNASIINALTGGIADEASKVSSLLLGGILQALKVLVTSQANLFSLLGNGVASGYNELTFFWSDMMHYRKTSGFAAALWKNAVRDEEKAFALGWMTHVATDIVGHSFVNEKCGGPYRIHSQRHHLIENYMDAWSYQCSSGVKKSSDAYYSICGSALHLWIAFEEVEGEPFPPSAFQTDGSIFDANAARSPAYKPPCGPSYVSRIPEEWDIDSSLPPGIADLLHRTMCEVFPANTTHPLILEGGYPTVDNLEQTYFYLFKYLKLITTDYYKLTPPEEPPVFPWPELPTMPGNSSDGSHDGDFSFWDLVLSIVAWIVFILDCILYFPALLAAAILGPLTWPFREAIYQFIELPLYNAWLSLRWLLSVTGFVFPLPDHITPMLYQLGIGWRDRWSILEAELNDVTGGILGEPPSLASTSEPVASGDKWFPRDAVTDPPKVMPALIQDLIQAISQAASGHWEEGASEFLRPWVQPAKDWEGDPVPEERPLTSLGPFTKGQDASILISGAMTPGDNAFRLALEAAKDPAETEKANAVLSDHKHLGDPADYSAYVIAKLTRDTVHYPDFNLDADRGYGYLCWDWQRDPSTTAMPHSYKDDPRHQYAAPVSPGFGWNGTDIPNFQQPSAPGLHPRERRPWEQPTYDLLITYLKP